MQLHLGIKPNWKDTHFFRRDSTLKTGVEIRLREVWAPMLRKAAACGGLRQALGVPAHMPITVTTVMPDTALDRENVIAYDRQLQVLKPNLFTTIEIPIYDGDKGRLLQLRVEEFCYQLEYLRERYPLEQIIVLVTGRTSSEVEVLTRFASEMGFTKFGIPCADPMQRDGDRTKREIHRDLRIICKYATETYLIGLTSPRHIEEFSYADHIITRGWFYSTMKFKQVITHNGSHKTLITPKVNSNQLVFSNDGTLELPDRQLLERQRSFELRQNAYRAIHTLFEKLRALTRQTKMEDTRWSVKAAAPPELTIAPALTQVQEESAVTHS